MVEKISDKRVNNNIYTLIKGPQVYCKKTKFKGSQKTKLEVK